MRDIRKMWLWLKTKKSWKRRAGKLTAKRIREERKQKKLFLGAHYRYTCQAEGLQPRWGGFSYGWEWAPEPPMRTSEVPSEPR